jgi:hypothetical protein
MANIVSKPKKRKIGLIQGNGTGTRLINIFKNFLINTIEHVTEDDFVMEDRVYHSYASLVEAAKKEDRSYQDLSKDDSNHLYQTVKKWYEEDDIRHIFRVSINAEALYEYRNKVGAIKENLITTNFGDKILFIRDMTEGYYTNEFYSISDNRIVFTGTYSKNHFQLLAQYTLERGEEIYNDLDGQWDLSFRGFYKHHLFGNTMEEWLKEISLEICLMQPDTGFSMLERFTKTGKTNSNTSNSKNEKSQLVVIFCSNEVGDIIHEPLLASNDIDAQVELFSRTIYLKSPFLEKSNSLSDFKVNFNDRLVEYQTLHGSADDIKYNKEDKKYNKVLLPFATLRIAATIGEEIFKVKNYREIVEQGIIQSKIEQNELISTDAIISTVTRYTQTHTKNLINS